MCAKQILTNLNQTYRNIGAVVRYSFKVSYNIFL